MRLLPVEVREDLLQLDRRTVKSKIDPKLLAQLRATG